VARYMRFAVALAMAVGLVLLTGCGEEGGGGSAGSAPPPPTVVVATPLQQDVIDWDVFTGRFEAVETVDVRSRVSGYVQSVHFDDGDLVEQGQLLYVIDQRPFLIAVDQARATLKEREAALPLAKAELVRARQLLGRNNISRSVYDERVQAELVAEAAISAAKAELDAAELDLAYTQIEAPTGGRISRNLVDVGNLVQGGAQGATLLTNIISINPIHFYFEADEATFLHYTRLAARGDRTSSHEGGQPVQLQLADETGFPHEGVVDFVENRVSGESGTITIRAVFQNANNLFTPGLFARVRLLGRGPYPALLVPEAAIGTDQSYKFVYVLDGENKPTYRRVTLGERRGDLRVVAEGLKPDDKVVIDGLLRVRPGSPVTPEAGTIEADGRGQ